MSNIEGNLLSRGIGWYLSLPEEIREDNDDLAPHIAGLSVLGLSYAAAAGLVAIDGPLPFGDALAAGILLVPDVFWYGLGYALFD